MVRYCQKFVFGGRCKPIKGFLAFTTAFLIKICNRPIFEHEGLGHFEIGSYI